MTVDCQVYDVHHRFDYSVCSSSDDSRNVGGVIRALKCAQVDTNQYLTNVMALNAGGKAVYNAKAGKHLVVGFLIDYLILFVDYLPIQKKQKI